ncbi:MAG: hypothetical protein OEV95_13315, partial [Gemmatimonadota bacterium]|nr:hypothetical protein [Gemmatimonadota bacterium]
MSRRRGGTADVSILAGLGFAGFGALAASVGIELLGVGSPGLGPTQLVLAVAGFGMLLLRDWWRSESATRTEDLVRYLTIAAELGALTLVL